MKKNYKLLSRAKQAVFALALAVSSGTSYSQTTYTFNYTGSVQTITLLPGNYEINCWGADGGAGGTASALTGTGGIGGYSQGLLGSCNHHPIHICWRSRSVYKY